VDVEDRLEIIDLHHRYAHTYDEGRLDHLGELFAEEATFEFRPPIGGFPDRLDGRDAIVHHMRERYAATRPAQRRHIMTNLVFDHQDERSARTSSYLVLGSTTDGQLALPVAGRYEDELGKREGRWCFLSRVLLLDASLG
jgi:3-phenylpropionate/cinnamic acid dioxygenase small subunit